MFCKTCGLSVDENIMYCPGCGNKLDRNSVSLNPLPGYVVHSNNEDTTDTTVEPEVIIIDNSETNNTDDIDLASSVKLDNFSEDKKNINVEEQSSQQSKRDFDNDTREPLSNQNAITDINNSQNNSEVLTTVNKTKRNLYKIITSLLAIAAVIGIIICIKMHLSKSNINNDTTEFINPPINVASATDIVSDDIVLEEDNFIISKSITIADKEYNSKDLQHFTDKTSGVNVTLYKIELDIADMQTYCDEQESAYQLQSGEILDVAYVGDAYRYHYAQGYYQFGILSKNVLVVYEISDNIDVKLCNEMAIDYFKTEGVIK